MMFGRANSEGGARKDSGAGEAIVGRRIKKANGSRGISEGHVRSYDVSSRLYQVQQLSMNIYNLFSIISFVQDVEVEHASAASTKEANVTMQSKHENLKGNL